MATVKKRSSERFLLLSRPILHVVGVGLIAVRQQHQLKRIFGPATLARGSPFA